ncbi:two-component system, sensor histidine kinase YesM [Evansella caseinilytica]|uniref:histidine kinase n=1 Tax=Evansella caseinilytica TaxID=1503961 RepID=A0A1H3U5E6_9BACI|nr:sensor histidine kinase [Evansella caseinilytica]SDZ57075.1 two-component system, sensor histidine kinase YesM [Evansella caseinilytica]
MRTLSFIRKISGKLFHRVFFTYSTIIFLTMASLFVFLSEYYSDFIIQREVDKHGTVIDELKSDFREKHQFVSQGVRNLYLEKDLIQDLAFSLQHDYEEYIGYRLEKFANSDSFVPYNFDIYVKNYFSRDDTVVALEIKNESLGTDYVYLFNHGRWQENTKGEVELEMDDSSRNESPFFYTVREQINDPISLDHLGTVSVYFTYDNLERIISLREETVKGAFLVTDEDMNVYFSHGDIPDGIVEAITYGTVQKELKLDDIYYLQSSVEPASELMMTAVIPRSELATLFTYKITILSIIMMLTVVAIALPYFSLRRHSKRVDQIVTRMREVQEGNLNIKIDTGRGNDDLSVISETFNETLDELNNYINKVYTSKIKQKEAELASLQTQINPHFLYNTLEAIRMKSLAEGGLTTAKMIVQLSELFRHSLKTAELVTLEEEQNHAHQYIELFKIRFPGQLTSHFEGREGLNHYLVPPFILQPLIENFLIHGFKQSSNDNRLQIKMREKKATLWIEIEDNGKGISEEKLAPLKQKLASGDSSSKSIGLANVNQRIKLKYGQAYGVDIESTPDVQTVVTVRLPVIER